MNEIVYLQNNSKLTDLYCIINKNKYMIMFYSLKQNHSIW